MKQLSCRIVVSFRLAICILLMGWLNVSHAGLIAIWGDTADGKGTLPQGLNNARAVAGGGNHSLALKSDGTVVAWGRVDDRNADAMQVPAGLSGVVSISAGDNHSVALTAAGKVVAWGNNLQGQTNVPAGLSKVTAIAAGPAHNLALKSDGTVVAWGWNFAGQATVPDGLTDVKAVAAGGSSLVLKQDGTVFAWGQTSFGLTNIPAGLSNVTAIAAGGYFNLALKADGTVAAWGNGDEGQTNVPPAATNVIAIAAGFAHGMALRSDGTVIVWGRNIFNQQIVPAGLKQVTAIAAGANHNLALTFEGPVQILQGPQPQEQAIPVNSNVTFTVVATGYEPLGYQWYLNGAAIIPQDRVVGATSASLTISYLQISDGGTYTVVVTNAFGSVLSSGATLAVGSPPAFTTVSAPNQTVRAGTNLAWAAFASGTQPLVYQWLMNGTNLPGKTSSSLTLLNLQPGASGIYTAFVTNKYGLAQTNISLTVTDSVPYITQQPFVTRQNEGGTAYPIVPLGGGIALAVNAGGTAPLTYQWRQDGVDIPGATNATLLTTNMSLAQGGFYNVEIQNALGGVISAKLFVNVVQTYVWDAKSLIPTNPPPGLTNAGAVAAGYYHALALQGDGRVAVWRTSAVIPPSAVTNVPSVVTNVAAIAAGGNNNMALRSNGTVVVWGELGAGVTNVPPDVTNIMAIAAGEFYCLALRSNGTVRGWGNQANSLTNPPAGVSNVIAIAAGNTYGVALKADGRVVTWGFLGATTSNALAGLSNVIAIDAAGSYGAVLREDGSVLTWTAGSTLRPSPHTNLVAMAVGTGMHLGIKENGGLVTWTETFTSTSPAVSNLLAVARGERDATAVATIGTGAPAFTIHPASQLVARSNTARLLVRTAGLLPARYQWQRDGANLPNATNASLTVSSIQGPDLGAYRCVAANARGTNFSNPALLSFEANTATLPEAVNAINLTWTTNFSIAGPPFPAWFPQNRETHGDDAAAQSGVITNGGQSILGTTITGPGTLTFWWKVSSEEGYDFLSYYFDNLNTPVQRLSGESGWLQVTQTVAAGTHTLRWTYSKDASVSAGRDAGWLDEVTFTPAPPTANVLPESATTTAGSNVSFFAVTFSEVKPISYQWMRFGTNLPGATNQTLSLPGVGRKDCGPYSVRVGNIGGSITTSNATLRVLVPQQLGSIQRLDNGGVELFSNDADGGVLTPGNLPAFEAQVSEDLANWVALPNCLSVTNGALRLCDPEGTIHPQRFYRIVER